MADVITDPTEGAEVDPLAEWMTDLRDTVVTDYSEAEVKQMSAATALAAAGTTGGVWAVISGAPLIAKFISTVAAVGLAVSVGVATDIIPNPLDQPEDPEPIPPTIDADTPSDSGTGDPTVTIPDVGDAVDPLLDTVGDVLDDTGEIVDDLVDDLTDTVGDVTDTVEDLTDDLVDTVGDVVPDIELDVGVDLPGDDVGVSVTIPDPIDSGEVDIDLGVDLPGLPDLGLGLGVGDSGAEIDLGISTDPETTPPVTLPGLGLPLFP